MEEKRPGYPLSRSKRHPALNLAVGSSSPIGNHFSCPHGRAADARCLFSSSCLPWPKAMMVASLPAMDP